jgi:hypothetical protein
LNFDDVAVFGHCVEEVRAQADAVWSASLAERWIGGAIDP